VTTAGGSPWVLRGGLKPQRQTEAGVYGDGVTTGLGSSGGGRSGGGGGWVWERGEVIWASAPDLELRAQGAPASWPGELTLGPGSRGGDRLSEARWLREPRPGRSAAPVPGPRGPAQLPGKPPISPLLLDSKSLSCSQLLSLSGATSPSPGPPTWLPGWACPPPLRSPKGRQDFHASL
jgi:hypothetical protein